MRGGGGHLVGLDPVVFTLLVGMHADAELMHPPSLRVPRGPADMPLANQLSLTGLLEAQRLAPANVGRTEVMALRRQELQTRWGVFSASWRL